MVLGLRAVRNDSLGSDGVANVEFLRRYWPQLADLASLAENYLYTDPNSTMITDIWTQAQPKDEWFVRGYSTVNEMEDRATVIEAVFSKDEAWWKEHPRIAAKLENMLEVMRPAFGEDVYFHE